MTTTNIKYNKISTVIIDNNNNCKVFVIKTKKELFTYISTLECFAMVVSQNINSVIKKIKELGFEVIVDDSFGFDYEVKLICSI